MTYAIKNFTQKFQIPVHEIEWWVSIFATLFSVTAIVMAYHAGTIIAYGDAESHLNIAKRVVDSLTPGFGQLGGIWLPLPHLLLAPFVTNDFLWRTGLAGSIVSGIAFVVSSVFIYKLVKVITDNHLASFFAAIVFILNPNILYMQTTPMTEIVLTAFFILSTYYFVCFLKQGRNISKLILAALFGLAASLTRYDGWALVAIEALVLVFLYMPVNFGKIKEVQNKLLDRRWSNLEGMVSLFSTLAFFGILLWFIWGAVILGDPFYFTHSQFSANSQQLGWLAHGELPAYKHIGTAFLYYAYTSIANAGVLVSILALVGLVLFLTQSTNKYRWYILFVLLTPFIFNIATLYLGQSVIFIPGLTPSTFKWNLFNVRYGILMIPSMAVCIGYLFFKLKGVAARTAVVSLVVVQMFFFAVGYAPVVSLADGEYGLSSSLTRVPDAQQWLAANYDRGTIITDDFSRSISIIRTSIPMKDVIYVGTQPYWEESLQQPEKYVRWIIMQRDDTVWKRLYDDPDMRQRLYENFNRVYTSDDLYIFRKI